MSNIPPAERDLFSLSCDTLADVNEALDAAIHSQPDAAAEPARTSQLADILMHKTVHLIRTGTLHAVAEAGLIVTRSAYGSTREELDQQQTQALKIQRAASAVLAAATSPDAPGAELALMRKTGHREAKILCTIADSDEQASNYAALYDQHPDHRQLQFALNNLDAAALIAYDTGRLYSNSKILLGPRFAVNPEVIVLARYYAEQFDNQETKS